jgi:tetratricopeptide (TPR) repeat protein
LDRKNPEVYCEIAKGCIGPTKKDTTTASKFLNLGFELKTDYAPLHITLGDYELLCHRHGPATNAYQRAYYYDPNSSLAYRKLGVIHTYARAYRDALNDLTKSIELNSDQILAYKNLGDLYYLIGKYPEAEKNYQVYMARAEVTYEDRERYAIILFFNKRYPEAAKLLEDTINHSLDVSVLSRIRGYIAYETGEYSKGVEHMSKFFKLHDPEKNIVSDYIYYGRLLQKTGKDALAIRNYNMALSLDSTKTDIYDELAKLYTTNKMHLDAVANYKKMIAIGADKVSTYFMIGKEYSYAGEIYRQKYDSLYALQKSSNLPFTDSTSVNNLKRLYFQKADSAFLIVTALNPQYAGGFIWRGRLNALLDPEAETVDAKEAYEKALGILEAGDVNKNRRSMIECYRYLGSYYFLSSERLFKADIKQSEALKVTSIDYFRKILKLDPNDAQALDVFKKLKIAP